LKDDNDLYTCGLSSSNVDGIITEYPILFRPSKKQSFYKRAKNYLRMKLGRYENLTWDTSVLKVLDCRSYDVIIVNDPREMPLAISLQRSNSTHSNIYFDLHEWYDQVDQNELVNRIFRTLTDKYFPLADETSTVNDEIADLYEKKYKIRPKVVSNAGKYFDIQPTLVIDDSVKMVHHGVLNASRKLEEMIILMNLLDGRFSLDLYLVGTDESYKNKLIGLADHNKVRFLPPVKFENIVPTLNGYDIGLFILQEDVESYKYALPNKLFEFIQGRLAVAISPNISMKKIVEKYDLGVVGDDFSAQALAGKLNELTISDINEMKSRSHFAATKLNEEEGIKTIKQIISSFQNSIN
jgi:hypothetical protein